MTFEQWMDRQYGKNWGVVMAAQVNALNSAFQAGRMAGIRECEREMRESARDAATETRWQERQGDEYGSY